MDMFNPPHPGETLREDVLPALGLSVTEAARQLGEAAQSHWLGWNQQLRLGKLPRLRRATPQAG